LIECLRKTVGDEGMSEEVVAMVN